jgi:hypothetical protein
LTRSRQYIRDLLRASDFRPARQLNQPALLRLPAEDLPVRRSCSISKLIF